MTTLTLALNGVYFDQIKAGTKAFEYRLRTPYWTKRLSNGPFRRIVLTRGYPARDDEARRITLPWRGFIETTIQHAHFGPGAGRGVRHHRRRPRMTWPAERASMAREDSK